MTQTEPIIDSLPVGMLQFLLSVDEARILDAAAHVKFGELLDVDIDTGERTVSRMISKACASFVETVRHEGLTFFHTVLVHNGVPAQAEINGQFSGITYRRKIRF